MADFSNIKRILKRGNAKFEKHSVSTHYYAPLTTNDVVKLTQHADKFEIHILQENNGNFILKQSIAVANKNQGLLWLINRGYKQVEIVKMECDSYSYKDGFVGLYTLNDTEKSLILDFPLKRYSELEKEFKLSVNQQLTIPYNAYLKKIGKLQTVDIAKLL